MNAYQESKTNNHDFIQGVRFTLLTNGLGNILKLSTSLKAKYVKTVVSLRLNDQYCQSFSEKLHKFDNLYLCKNKQPYECSSYLDRIRNVKIRNIFTKLRLGCNRLKAYSHSENIECDHCKAPETVSHMLFTCTSPKLIIERDKFMNQISSILPTFAAMPLDNKLSLMMNLDFKDDNAVDMSCSFVKNIYNLRFNRNP